MSDKTAPVNGTLPEHYAFVDEMNLPGYKERFLREMWCLLTRRDLLPMVLPKKETNTTAVEPGKET